MNAIEPRGPNPGARCLVRGCGWSVLADAEAGLVGAEGAAGCAEGGADALVAALDLAVEAEGAAGAQLRGDGQVARAAVLAVGEGDRARALGAGADDDFLADAVAALVRVQPDGDLGVAAGPHPDAVGLLVLALVGAGVSCRT